MWYVKPKRKPDWTAARKYLSRVDPVLGKIIKRVGPCKLVPRRDYYILLCVAIFNQQISTKAAAAVWKRFRCLFPNGRPTPARVLKILIDDPERIRGCGVSRQKRGYLLDLSQRFVDRKIPVRRFANMSDDEISQSLIQVKGIGRWTAEMFLMFVMNRPDVLPVDDLGLQEATKRVYKLKQRPTKDQLTKMGEKWRPWRTIATWYLWRGLEG